MMTCRALVWLSCALLLAAGCRGATTQTPRTQRPIDVLRERAASNPDDPSIWTELAIHEHLGDGGDPAQAHRALERARRLAGDPLRLALLAAELDVLEGRPQAALERYLEVLERSATSADPLATLIAEASVAAVLDMNDATDGYRPRVDAAFQKLLPSAEKLGLNAAHLLKMRELGRAFSRGDMAAAEAHANAAGCVRKAEVAGAFGPRELLGFDEKLPGEGGGALAKDYDLGPGRGKQPTRTVETRRCVLGLGRGSHEALPGTTLARLELEADRDGVYALRLESPNSIQLWLDGRELMRVDLRAQHASGARFIPVTLSKGRHELKAKITSRHPNPALSVALVPATEAQIAANSISTVADPFERFLAAKLLLNRGDPVSARELLRGGKEAEPTATMLVLSAAAALADPLRPSELRRDVARDLLARALKQNGDAWYPQVGLASLSAMEGQLKESIDRLRSARKKWPEVVAVRTSLIEQLRERGWGEEADRAVEELEKSMPNACAVVAISLATAKARGRMSSVRALTERAMACDVTSNARFAVLRAERRYDEAARELERLRALGDVLDAQDKVESDLEIALIEGDQAKIDALRKERAKLWPDRPNPLLDNADMLLAKGSVKEARALISGGIAAYPGELYDLRRISEALGDAGLFDAFRKNGDEIIRTFEASGRKYDGPQVLLLDYTVVRIFEDGSSADLTHNIFRLQSQEAVDDNGEYSPPEGGRLLKLRTVKANGQKLEPDVISGKSSLSLPNLSVGDYVEVEHVRGHPASSGFPGGYLGDRFYFKSFEVPFDHSELVVVMPSAFEPLLDPRGPAPTLVSETRDGLKVLRFKANESRPLIAEPSSVASREFLPSINLGIRVDWQGYIDSLRDLLADKDVYDPAAAEMVATLLAELKDAPISARAGRLFRWVTEEIEPTDDVFGVAPAMLAARTGSRDRVLRYMLRLAGIESDMALLRGAEADHSPALLPDPETYGYLTLRVKTERGDVWLHTGQRDVPFGFLPPNLRDEEALLIGPKLTRVRTPSVDSEQADLKSVDVEVKLAADGSAVVHVRETLRGSAAIGWRNDLDEVPSAELDARFEESYVVRLVPGASLKSIKIGERDDPEKPLLLDYELEVASLGRREGDQLHMPGMFPAALAGSLARTAQRTVPELIGTTIATDVRMRFVLPKGVEVLALPVTLQRNYGAAKFSASARVEGSEVVLERSLRMPVLRVAPAEYPAFADFCRAVDLAEATELAIKMP
jgi:tetratricopeptide (TPR) repeat protein